MTLFAVVSFITCQDDNYSAYQEVEGVFIKERDAISHCMSNREKVLYLFPVTSGESWPTLPVQDDPPSGPYWDPKQEKKLKRLGVQAFSDGERFSF